MAWLGAVFDRLSELFDELGVEHPAGPEDASAWMHLAAKMVVKYEPSLNPFPGKPGAPQSALASDVFLLHAMGPGRKPGVSIRAAANHLASKGRFAGMSPGYLRRRYYALRDPGRPESQRVREFLSELADREESGNPN